MGVPGGAQGARPRQAVSTRPGSARSGACRRRSARRSTRCAASAACRSLEVYTRGREHEDLYQLAELLTEWDERVSVWRVRHFKVVAARSSASDVVGTQGTPVEVLGRLIHQSFFPELWDVRNELTRMNLPE